MVNSKWSVFPVLYSYTKRVCCNFIASHDLVFYLFNSAIFQFVVNLICATAVYCRIYWNSLIREHSDMQWNMKIHEIGTNDISYLWKSLRELYITRNVFRRCKFVTLVLDRTGFTLKIATISSSFILCS